MRKTVVAPGRAVTGSTVAGRGGFAPLATGAVRAGLAATVIEGLVCRLTPCCTAAALGDAPVCAKLEETSGGAPVWFGDAATRLGGATPWREDAKPIFIVGRTAVALLAWEADVLKRRALCGLSDGAPDALGVAAVRDAPLAARADPTPLFALETDERGATGDEPYCGRLVRSFCDAPASEAVLESLGTGAAVGVNGVLPVEAAPVPLEPAFVPPNSG